MVTISKRAAASAYALDLYSRIHQAAERIALFEKRYGQPLAAFERRMRSAGESFGAWDDYMEWKACVETLRSLQSQIRDVKSGNFRVA